MCSDVCTHISFVHKHIHIFILCASWLIVGPEVNDQTNRPKFHKHLSPCKSKTKAVWKLGPTLCYFFCYLGSPPEYCSRRQMKCCNCMVILAVELGLSQTPSLLCSQIYVQIDWTKTHQNGRFNFRETSLDLYVFYKEVTDRGGFCLVISFSVYNSFSDVGFFITFFFFFAKRSKGDDVQRFYLSVPLFMPWLELHLWGEGKAGKKGRKFSERG